MEATYDQIISRIKDVNALDARELLLWLAFAETPIHIEGLAKIVEFEVEDQAFNPDAKLDNPEDVLKICPSPVTKMMDDTVQLAHASIKEYILNKQRKIGPHVELDPNVGHSFVGRCCLAYMLHTNEIYFHYEDVPDTFKQSLLQYSAWFWSKHIQACNEELSVMDQIKKLFQSGNLAKWSSAYNHHCHMLNWDSCVTPMLYPNYLQMAALHGLIETVKWIVLQPVTEVECMEALEAAAYNGHGDIVTLYLSKEI